MNPLVPTIKVATYAIEHQMPKILTGVAAGASVAACVTTGIATWHGKDIVGDYNERSEQYKKLIENESNELKKEEYEAELRKLRYLTAAELACEYAVPAVILGGSIAAGVGSAQIFTKRIGVMAASYASLAASYKAYRNRVAKQYGAEKEDELYKGIIEKEIEYTDENGKKVKKKVKTYDIPANGEFCVFWIQGNNPYSFDDPDLDINFLEASEEALTRAINEKGYICADEAYKSIGITPPTVPLGGKTADYVGKIWHNFGVIKSQDRINSVVEWLENIRENGEWIKELSNWIIDNTADERLQEQYRKFGVPRECLTEAAWEKYSEEKIMNANRFSWGISEEQKRAFRNGETDGMILLCPNLDGDIFTGGAFMTLKDEDVYLDESYFGMRPYE